MKVTARVSDISFDYLTGKPKVTLTIDEKAEFLNGIDDLRNVPLSVDIKKWRPKRSLDANAYAWVLMGKLAENQGITVDEVYRHHIREVGGNSNIVCVSDKALDMLRSAWEERGKGWVTETLPSRLEGCTNIILYYGSSTFDTAQMSRLIDNVVQDCKACGVETASEAELALLKEGWK